MRRLKWISGVYMPLLMLAEVSGCACAEKLRNKCCYSPPAPVEANSLPATITVGGKVHQPQRIALDQNGLTLSSALSLVGGPRLENSSDTASPSDQKLTEGLANLERSIEDVRSSVLALQNVADKENKLKFNATIVGRAQAENQILSVFSSRLPGDPIDGVLSQLKILSGQLQTQAMVVRNEVTLANRLSDTSAKRIDDVLNEYGPILDGIRAQTVSRHVVTLATPTREPMLVCVKRAAGTARGTYYFPYDAVQTDAAGKIALQDGDQVAVVPARDSTLLSPQQLDGDSLAISGLVNRAGTHSVRTITRLGDVKKLTPQRLNTDEASLVLTRLAADRLGVDTYILPLPDPTDLPFGIIGTMPGDNIQVVPKLTAPLIMQSVVGSVVNQVMAEQEVPIRVDGFCQKIRAKHQGSKGKSLPGSVIMRPGVGRP